MLNLLLQTSKPHVQILYEILIINGCCFNTINIKQHFYMSIKHDLCNELEILMSSFNFKKRRKNLNKFKKVTQEMDINTRHT